MTKLSLLSSVRLLPSTPSNAVNFSIINLTRFSQLRTKYLVLYRAILSAFRRGGESTSNKYKFPLTCATSWCYRAHRTSTVFLHQEKPHPLSIPVSCQICWLGYVEDLNSFLHQVHSNFTLSLKGAEMIAYINSSREDAFNAWLAKPKKLLSPVRKILNSL